MANYLTIDIGNSSAKAALWDDERMVGPSQWGALTAVDIEHICAQAGGPVECAAICSVAFDSQGLSEAARRLSRRCICVDSSTPVPIDLSSYKTLGTLGPDRIAALAGARALCPGQPLLVVDCGTAITYDRLTAEGKFIGGNIAPGIGMRLRALHAFTARLPEVETDPDPVLWGQSTVEAMQAGALRGVLGEIMYYRGESPAGTATVLTGGRAADLSDKLPFTTTVASDLVLRGLMQIIKYNENK